MFGWLLWETRARKKRTDDVSNEYYNKQRKVKHIIYFSTVLCVVQLVDLLSTLGSLWVGQHFLVKFRRTYMCLCVYVFMCMCL